MIFLSLQVHQPHTKQQSWKCLTLLRCVDASPCPPNIAYRDDLINTITHFLVLGRASEAYDHPIKPACLC